MAKPMTQPMTNADAAAFTARAGKLCEQLIAEGAELYPDRDPTSYALTLLVHAAALGGAYSLGPNADRTRVLQATAQAQKSLAGAMTFYHQQLDAHQVALMGGLN